MQLHRLEKGAIIRGFPVSALRAEARKGRLQLIKVANRHYVSDEAIDEMVRQCSETKVPGSGLKGAKAAKPSSSSAMERRSSALVYLQANMKKPNSASRNT